MATPSPRDSCTVSFSEFRPVAKIWLATNHRPCIMGGDLGIWRRILTAPFRMTIRPEEVNPDLPERLLNELAGILAWAAAGCLDSEAGGLQVPSTVRDATETYRQEQDSVGAFLDERTEEPAESWQPQVVTDPRT